MNDANILQPQSDTQKQASGVMNQGGAPSPSEPIPPPPPKPPQPEAVTPTSTPEPSRDTFVVPPIGRSDGERSINIPAPQSSGNGLGGKVVVILLILLIIAGFGAGGWYLYGMFTANKKAEITYWGLWENDAIIAPIIADFEAQNPNITVTYVRQNHRQYLQRLQYAIGDGSGPDVFRFHNTWVGPLRNELAIVPKDTMTVSEFNTTFYPVASRDLIAGEAIFGLPLMIEGLGLYCNDDLFTAAGVNPPTTYEELQEVVPRLTVTNGQEIVTSAIALGETGNIEHFSDIITTMMFQNGASFLNPNVEQSDRAEQTLIYYKKFSTPGDPLYTWNERMDNNIVAFANGRVAMIMAPSWRAHEIALLNPALRFHIEPIPQLAGNTVTWASYWVEGVSSQSKNQDEAWQFVKFLTSRESAQKLYTEAGKTRLFGEPYARKDMASSLSQDPYVGAYVVQAEYARSFPLASRTHDQGLNDNMIQYLENAVNAVLGGAAPSGALATAMEGFRQVLTNFDLSGG